MAEFTMEYPNSPKMADVDAGPAKDVDGKTFGQREAERREAEVVVDYSPTARQMKARREGLKQPPPLEEPGSYPTSTEIHEAAHGLGYENSPKLVGGREKTLLYLRLHLPKLRGERTAGEVEAEIQKLFMDETALQDTVLDCRRLVRASAMVAQGAPVVATEDAGDDFFDDADNDDGEEE